VGSKYTNRYSDEYKRDAIELLTDSPTSQAAARLGEARMAAFCKRHVYRGSTPASALLARLRSRRPGQPPHACPHRAHHGTSPPPGQSAGHHHPARNDHQEASRQAHGVYSRWAANTRTRKAVTAFAHNSRMQSPWAAALYANARGRGKSNPHATRIVARARLRVIWACWHNATPYYRDTPPHNASQPAALAQRTRTSCLPTAVQDPGTLTTRYAIVGALGAIRWATAILRNCRHD
jgi:hypothetical protein